MEGVTLAYPVEANGVFAALPPAVTGRCRPSIPSTCGTRPPGVVRWMASFDTTAEDVDAFVDLVSEVMGELG